MDGPTAPERDKRILAPSAATMAKLKAERDDWIANAKPVVVVGFRIPFDDVLRLLVQILIGQTLFAIIILLVLRMLGTI